jgi:ABC-2 type transport system permease protein
MNWRRTRAMFRKEFLHIIRDPRSLAAALLQPMMMLMLFGYALSLDVDRIPIFVYDQSNTPQSHDLIQQFRGSRYFAIAGQQQGYGPIDRAMNKSQALIGLVIPSDFATNIMSAHEDADVQLLIDGSDSNTASIAVGYAESLVQMYSAQMRADMQSMRAGQVLTPAVEARVRVFYNTDLVSRDYIVPGLIAVILMIIASILTSLTIAREWENGTMEQLLSTPVRPAEIALGKLGAYFVLGMVDMLISLAVALYVFEVPFKGSPTLLFISSCVFLFGALAWGIFISASTRSQLVAYQLSTFTSFLPAFLLSGFIYSLQNMPRIIQFIALFVPARYFINIVSGIFLKGVGLEILWFNFLLLVLYGVVVFYFATQKLRQKVA